MKDRAKTFSETGRPTAADVPPLLECYRTFDQIKEEHDALKKRLRELSQTIKWNPAGFEYVNCAATLRQTEETFRQFMDDLNRYLAREERVLFPVAMPYTGGAMGPVKVLEQDYILARQFYETFLEKNERYAATGDPKDAEEAISCLLQVLMIVSEHFRVEEDAVFPTAESLMEDIEYGSL